MSTKSLYERLGGYDAIVAVSGDLLPRLMSDSRLKRFWEHRGADGIAREKQLLIDFLCANSGGPMYYTGRDMKVSHKGMKISEADWTAFLGHVNATLDAFKVPSDRAWRGRRFRAIFEKRYRRSLTARQGA